jgi:hypothetical protein
MADASGERGMVKVCNRPLSEAPVENFPLSSRKITEPDPKHAASGWRQRARDSPNLAKL